MLLHVHESHYYPTTETISSFGTSLKTDIGEGHGNYILTAILFFFFAVVSLSRNFKRNLRKGTQKGLLKGEGNK